MKVTSHSRLRYGKYNTGANGNSTELVAAKYMYMDLADLYRVLSIKFRRFRATIDHEWVWFYQQNTRDPLDRDCSNGTCSLVCQYIIEVHVRVDLKVESGAAMAALAATLPTPLQFTNTHSTEKACK